jgi:glycerol uptake facilitator protein
MNIFAGEFIGTAILIALGNGVVANVVLNKTKGNGGGLIAVTFGWAIAVFVAVFCATKIAGGAHLNSAITIAFAVANKTPWSEVPTYIIAQVTGAMLGSLVVYLGYRSHYDATEDGITKRVTFCTYPAIKNTINNLLTEIIGTFILVFAVFYLAAPTSSLGALDAFPVALIVLGVGLSFGGPTGYAINPARDLGPRLLHAILPLKNKASNDWGYGWIPVVGPVVGALLAALLFKYI